MDNLGTDSVKSEEVGGDFEFWTEEIVDIETPFSNASQDDIEYLKLEIAELKQILIALAEKYKLSVDRRKVAERRNSFLKADNMRLQHLSDTSLSQKIEAEIENRRTLDKLREFIGFKQEFEKQAELLKKIISHLPRMKNASTSTCLIPLERSEQCSGDSQPLNTTDLSTKFIDPYYTKTDDNKNTTLIIDCTGDNFKLLENQIKMEQNSSTNFRKENYYNTSDSVIEILERESPEDEINDMMKETKGKTLGQMALSICENLHQEKLAHSELIESQTDVDPDVRAWDPKLMKEPGPVSNAPPTEMKTTKSKVKLSKLKQEVQALKNLNEWKSSDLDYKNRQLVVKNRELSHAKKEITQLKMRVNRLLVEQQKRPLTSNIAASQTKVEVKNSKSDKGIKENSKSHQRDAVKAKISSSKNKLPPDDKRKTTTSVEPVKNTETLKLPLSTESVWREIAPGDQVRIKVKKQAVD